MFSSQRLANAFDPSSEHDRIPPLGHNPAWDELSAELRTLLGLLDSSIEGLLTTYDLDQPRYRTDLPIIRPPSGCENSQPPTTEEVRNGSPSSSKLLEYQDLPTATCVRVLKVLPLDSIDSAFDVFRPPVRCSLLVVDLDNDPPFDALSYTWGDPCTVYLSPDEISSEEAWRARPFDIEVDGKLVSVGSNLYAALLSFRAYVTKQALGAVHPHTGYPSSGYLWVDALCINQDDLDEKNHQVQMMARVYRQASLVYAWLGGEDRFSREAMEAIARLKFPGSQALLQEMGRLKIMSKETYKRLNMPVINYTIWTAIYMLLNRSWFKRAWVVQEITHARRCLVFCGLHHLTLDQLNDSLSLLKAVYWLEQLEEFGTHLVQGEDRFSADSVVALGSKAKLFKSRPAKRMESNWGRILIECRARAGTYSGVIEGRVSEQPLSLLRLMNLFNYTEAGDPKDIIYAILSLARLEDQSIPGIDYRKSVEDVFCETAASIIASSGNLDIFSLISPNPDVLRHNSKQDKAYRFTLPSFTLPSWVPNFANDHLPGYNMKFRDEFSASSGLDRTDSMMVQGRRLRLSGLKAGKVAYLLPLSSEGSISQLGTLFKMVSIPAIPPSPDNEEETRKQKFQILAKILFMGIDTSPTRSLGTPVQLLSQWLEYIVLQQQDYIISELKLEISRLWLNVDSTVLVGGRPHSFSRGRFTLSTARAQLELQYKVVQELLGRRIPEGSVALPPDYVEFEKRYASLSSPQDRFLYLTRFSSECGASKMKVPPEEILEYKRAITRMELYQLCATERGQLGLCPRTAAVGDEVWVVAGGDVPLLLRPTGDSEFHLIGEVYMHGLMDGEAYIHIMLHSLMQSILRREEGFKAKGPELERIVLV